MMTIWEYVIIWNKTPYDDIYIGIVLILSDLYYAFNEFAHTLFVVKYWVISKKINGIITKQEDPWLEIKSYVILGSILVLVSHRLSWIRLFPNLKFTVICLPWKLM